VPIYEYVCAACGHHWELIVARDAPVPPCPLCDKPGKKAISAPAFQFKGSGWYVTDYAKSGADSKKQAKAEGAANKAAENKTSASAAGSSTQSEAPATKTEIPAAKAEAPAAVPAKPASTSAEKS
jgi:putative FmdB family regulatory protein